MLLIFPDFARIVVCKILAYTGNFTSAEHTFVIALNICQPRFRQCLAPQCNLKGRNTDGIMPHKVLPLPKSRLQLALTFFVWAKETAKCVTIVLG